MVLMPTISVIIPTYNRAHLIGASIASVLAQTYTNFELIVVDDGSTDDTEQQVHGFNDPRINYINQENKGRSHARNCALDLARGRYIAFLDSDDLFLPDKLALQVAYLDSHPHVGMVYTSAYCIDYSGNALSDRYLASVSGKIYKSIAFFRPVTITLPTVMARRELFAEVGGFDVQMHRFEDTDMWRRISKVTHIAALPEFTCKLRTHTDNSLAEQRPDQIISSLNYYAQKILHEDAGMGRVSMRRGLGGLYYYYGRAFLTIPEWRDAGADLLRTAYRYWPPYAGLYLLVSSYLKIVTTIASRLK
jgi:glycosyltransferase involved in cell wall biosynthesis